MMIACYLANDLILQFSFFPRLNTLDIVTAVNYLDESDQNLQTLGAAYIQHECYNNKDAKKQVYNCFPSEEIFEWNVCFRYK